MKAYISGPMTGIENFNMPAFNKASLLLKEKGYEPVLPVTYVEGKSYQQYLKEDIKELLECDYIFLLDNWRNSHGANLEYIIARECGIEELKL